MSLGARPRYVGTRWYLVQADDGTFSVLKRGRQMVSGVPLARARQFLRGRMGPGDQAFHEAPDGYRTRL